MQTLDVISVNLWQIIIALLNLLLLFLIIKFFLFKPVKKMLAKRQQTIDEQYKLAQDAELKAQENKALWEERLNNAQSEADDMISKASETASKKSDKIIEEAKEKADYILRQAELNADLERKKAEDDIKREIVDVSTVLTEKLLSREINEEDHRSLIDSFIEKIGDNYDRTE
ncbi:MAG: F0F1 ATP synthase subunit B [Clostridia bacterium]|nr:F0F1 ATP synthase subunit B [Clostridia bacterium]MBR6647481.1 F0F1 ATP synthase subunit B [Clostridia bacterium]